MEAFGGGAGSGPLRPDPILAAGPVVCGGLWHVTAVDSSSSSSSSSALIRVADTWYMIIGECVVARSEAA